MTERVRKRLEFFNARTYRSARNLEPSENVTEKSAGCTIAMRSANRFVRATQMEIPNFYGDDPIGFNQYRVNGPIDDYMLHVGYGNITVDYAGFLKGGLQGLYDAIAEKYDGADQVAKEFYDAALICLDGAKEIAQRYQDAAKERGNERLYNALLNVPFYGARDYYEAVISVRFLQFILRLNKTKHVTIGRFDQYAKPYFDLSKQKGATDEELLEITELFFLSLNFDSDIYEGIQTGDNGQSFMLGGCDKDGNDAFNELSEICLTASEELKVIDPKINIRVNKNTPLSLYERGTKLTKQGLGFPQYSNDDVVIPGLVALGYDLEDARDYAVAACWEFIVPACGADYPNIATMNFPLMVERATKKYLLTSESFADFMQKVKSEITLGSNELMQECIGFFLRPEPLLSLFVLPCVEKGRDIFALGAKYNNYGIHGAGISNAADALEAIEKAVFVEKSVDKETLLTALEKNYEGYEFLRKQMQGYAKKGNNEESVDAKAVEIMDAFATAVNGKPNDRGGVYRAGTGSAMEYVLSAAKVGATADGRKAGEPYGSSYSPSLSARLNGPLSAIASFTKYDLKNTINGGPFTIEIHDTVFRNDEGEKKVAMLIKAYIDKGGHQIQINAINRDKLLDAQKHPEKYPNLIVRVWGWSGYFNELDTVYQDHIIKRVEFSV